MKKISLLLASCCLTISNAHALLITPGSSLPNWTGSNNSNLNASAVTGVVGGSLLSLAYKQDVGGAESGPFASSYTTTFNSNRSGALIDFISGPSLTGSLFLYVKDGNHQPAFYIFDISSWNRTEDLVLSNFWPGPGSISNIAIFSRPGSTTQVPEGGATAMFFAISATSIAVLRRRWLRAI